jgi:hypothetical protein
MAERAEAFDPMVLPENDVRQVKQLGPFGQWMRDRLFPLFVPLIGRELERQYAARAREIQVA